MCTAHFNNMYWLCRYSWVILEITLSRKSRAYVQGVGVPSLLFAGTTPTVALNARLDFWPNIGTAYAGLFINRQVAPARVASALLPVLIMLNLMIGEAKAIPKCDYRVRDMAIHAGLGWGAPKWVKISNRVALCCTHCHCILCAFHFHDRVIRLMDSWISLLTPRVGMLMCRCSWSIGLSSTWPLPSF